MTSGYVTVSARVRRELYEELKRYNIDVGEVLRRALEEELEKREEELRAAARELQEFFSRLPEDEIARLVKEQRRARRVPRGRLPAGLQRYSGRPTQIRRRGGPGPA
ncbi:hypothetical protein [Pyrodictium abyssi]|uniref:Ribbon-helix-helix protein CopG domain-containing protein n=1 Tax=Pyrodictium abyssi TaxID=54256 RepID=A0ABN6ZW45_9CREN|nr:hypothetical protein PABY_19750 [Pyrodictium abyssi]